MKPIQFGMGHYLRERGLISDIVAIYHSRTRDRADLEVNICKDTGVIFLNSNVGSLWSHYRDKCIENDGKTSISNVDATKITTTTLQDSERRFNSFRDIAAKRWFPGGVDYHSLFEEKVRCGNPFSRSRTSS
jgi:hypothetical protein